MITLEFEQSRLYGLVKFLAGVQVKRGKITDEEAAQTITKYGYKCYIVINNKRFRASWQSHQLQA